MKTSATRWLLPLCLLAGLPAHALYKVVGPDGKITYTDRPPPETAKVQPLSASGGPTSGGVLPYELQQVVGRFPVTLYTMRECPGCDAGRALLRQRGVPYTEKTVNTPQDVQAFSRLSGGTDLPLLQVGGQRIKGFGAGEWNSWLDTAGYPKQSTLPANWQFAPATPMVAVAPAPAQAGAPAPTPAPATAVPPPPAGNAPPGFKF
ncbi:glutaredoxin family protein [Aquabacterium sp. A7-Y]|uniref:glutaredoxin domain-containing protein n=1 Tax=Aquabacterium sp. A7-Y TaxID=1349605 RepID=UPI00223E5747|nr:glutaredoxin domain-containing protein [Aquabacterium sp. A7-Y]MCW7537496.1 glutaredoxin family protein [Aquabacterium sp. A7-Y]